MSDEAQEVPMWVEVAEHYHEAELGEGDEVVVDGWVVKPFERGGWDCQRHPARGIIPSTCGHAKAADAKKWRMENKKIREHRDLED